MSDREIFKNLDKYMGKEVVLEGWIKNHRKQKRVWFYIFL